MMNMENHSALVNEAFEDSLILSAKICADWFVNDELSVDIMHCLVEFYVHTDRAGIVWG